MTVCMGACEKPSPSLGEQHTVELLGEVIIPSRESKLAALCVKGIHLIRYQLYLQPSTAKQAGIQGASFIHLFYFCRVATNEALWRTLSNLRIIRVRASVCLARRAKSAMHC